MSFRENDEENLAHTVFTQYINEQENQMEAELAFDASFFKANRKVSYPNYYFFSDTYKSWQKDSCLYESRVNLSVPMQGLLLRATESIL